MPRPDTPLPKRLSTSLTYGLDLSQWPSSANFTALDSYRRLGFNTVPDQAFASPSSRRDWAKLGLRFGPQFGCPFTIPAMSVAAARAANMSRLCPGLSPARVATERDKLVAAAEFRLKASRADANAQTGLDIGYDGCLRDEALTKLRQKYSQWRPDVAVYDWEGWPDFEYWVANVQISANAQRQRRPGESQADLAYRMSRNWFDDMINTTRSASPQTDTQLYGGWAADNKGCCSGSKLGIFDWRML